MKTNQETAVFYEDESIEEEEAVLFTRISFGRADKTSPQTQKRDMRSFCKTYHLKVVGEFEDLGVSAYKDVERPEFEKAMAMIESGEAKVLVVWKLDRLTRNILDFWKIVERLKAAGATFRSVKEPFLDTSSPMAMAIVGLFAALAEEEAKGIQERMLGWHETRRQNGNCPTGPRPYGFMRPKKGQAGWVKGGTLIVVPEEALIIQEAAARVIAGEEVRAIARDFQARKIKTAKGAAWTHSTIRGILLNPVTYGLMKDETAGSWDTILDVETFEAIKGVLIDPTRSQFRPESSGLKYLLPNLMKCGKCESGMLITHIHSKGRQYGCNTCDLSIMASTADDLIEELVLSWPQDKWESLLTQGKGNDPKVVAEIQQRIDEAFIDRATNPNRVSPAVYEAVMANLESQLEAAMTAPKVDIPNVPNLKEGWVSMSLADKRRVIVALFDYIKVLPHAKGQTGRGRFEVAIKPTETNTKKGK